MNKDQSTPPICGTWQLETWIITYSHASEPTYPFGKHAQGLICYTSDGYMSATISVPERKQLSTASVRQASSDEKVNAFESFFCYAGPYKIEGDYVLHSVEQSLNPNFVGTVQKRKMTFIEPNQLILSAIEPSSHASGDRHHQLIWNRAR